jgi:uncharacterized cupredoxin-like copper-binding protein
MNRLNSLLLAATIIGALGASSAGALAAATVNVTLTNQSITSDLPNNLGMAMPGADMSKAVMSVVASPNVVPAGEVTFVATNKSADFTHEMIVVKVSDSHRPLPYVPTDTKVNEDAAGHLGEVSELDPGASGKLSLNLDPGTYMLLCNVPGHYMAGMWTTITVR